MLGGAVLTGAEAGVLSGVLCSKAVGVWESFIAALIVRAVGEGSKLPKGNFLICHLAGKSMVDGSGTGSIAHIDGFLQRPSRNKS